VNYLSSSTAKVFTLMSSKYLFNEDYKMTFFQFVKHKVTIFFLSCDLRSMADRCRVWLHIYSIMTFFLLCFFLLLLRCCTCFSKFAVNYEGILPWNNRWNYCFLSRRLETQQKNKSSSPYETDTSFWYGPHINVASCLLEISHFSHTVSPYVRN
jgi:hypothetical protein